VGYVLCLVEKRQAEGRSYQNSDWTGRDDVVAGDNFPSSKSDVSSMTPRSHSGAMCRFVVC
jgi:hypothetical protein